MSTRTDASPTGPATSTDVLIVGAGFSGLGMAIKLREAGREDFLLVEKAYEVGGTWRDNTYPGCACDIPSHLYSFSYEQNPDWTRAYSPQPEIYAYLRRVADGYDLRRSIRFGVEVASARWEADAQRWAVTAVTGEVYSCRVLVNAVGALHIPYVPGLDGTDDFLGPAFHSARWRHDVDLTGKRVAVVGTGASAIQFIPEIAKQAAEVRVFQRSAPWVLRKPDHAMSERTRAAFRRVPGLQRAYRDLLYWLLESRAIGFNGHPRMLQMAERMMRRYVERTVSDPVTRELLVPDYRLGCKRVLMSNDYLKLFEQPHVSLHGHGVRSLTKRGVVDGDGVEHEVDVVIWGTGFHVTDSFSQLHITGRGGRDLATTFERDGIETYLGMNVAGFPNLVLLLGPNTGLGHNSVVFMIEQQVRYVLRLLDAAEARGAGAFEVTRTAQDRFNSVVQAKLARGIWSTGGCTSWYLDSSARNRSIWPGFTWRYWLQTLRVDADSYCWEPAPTAPSGVRPGQSMPA
jgi:cation diffusion facilitator CzcD-associated flavoprotein CzcO